MAQSSALPRSKRRGRSAHSIGATTGPATSNRKLSLAARAKHVLAKLNPAACAVSGTCRDKTKLGAAENVVAMVGGLGGLFSLLALLALILFIVVMTKLPRGCSLSGFGVAGIVTTFLFPPAGVVLNSMGIANPARFCS
jgi:hypothetical protein